MTQGEREVVLCEGQRGHWEWVSFITPSEPPWLTSLLQPLTAFLLQEASLPLVEYPLSSRAVIAF